MKCKSRRQPAACWELSPLKGKERKMKKVTFVFTLSFYKINVKIISEKFLKKY